MKKYDDPGDDKQICQKTGEGKNLDEGDWKTLEIFYDSTKISWEDKKIFCTEKYFVRKTLMMRILMMLMLLWKPRRLSAPLEL